MRKPAFFLFVTILAVLIGLATGNAAGGAETPDRLRILTAENPPLNFSGDGEITGLATEVVRELIKRTGTVSDIEMVGWPEGLPGTCRASQRRALLHGHDGGKEGAFPVGGSAGDTGHQSLRFEGIDD